MHARSLTGPMAVAMAICAGAGAQAQEATRVIEAAEGRNIVEFFLGGTWADHRGSREGAGSVGASYRYEFTEIVSAGILAEYTFDPFDSWIVGIPVVFNLGQGWQLTAMPGVEFEGDDKEALFRLGIGYEIEMEGYTLKPEINADFVDGETAVVAGLSIGFRF